MKPRLASLAFPFVLLTACAPAAPPPPVTPAPPVTTAVPDRPPPPVEPDAGATPRPIIIHGDTYAAALAATKLRPLDLKPTSRTMVSSFPGGRTIEGRRLTMVVQAGYRGEGFELVENEAGYVMRVHRKPVEKVKEVFVNACKQFGFAGGRAWFEQVVYELPAGKHWGPDITVEYPEVTEVIRYADKQSDGSPCPPPHMAVD